MHSEIGLNKGELDTPALCVDLEALEYNIGRVADLCREHGVAWRPHAKCHKSPDVARMLVAAGAIGATCAKLGEAEVLAEAGLQDLLIANLLVGAAKVARLVELRRKADPIVCVDHLDQARPIGQAMHAAGQRVRVLLEVDIGMSRVGVAPGAAACELALRVSDLPGLEFAGIMGYEGHLLLIEDQAEKAARIREALDRLAQTRDQCAAHGVPCRIVSCGGTGSLAFCVTHPAATEIQAGGAIFMDEFYRHRCRTLDLRQALTVVATVVSRPAPDRIVIDAGRKSINQELAPVRVLQPAGCEVTGLSAEHGILRRAADAPEVAIGERVELIPGYSDFTTVLHDRFYATRQDRVEAIWPLAARGKLR